MVLQFGISEFSEIVPRSLLSVLVDHGRNNKEMAKIKIITLMVISITITTIVTRTI